MEIVDPEIIKKLDWNPPKIYSLSIKKTNSGGDPALTEDTPNDPSPVGS